MKELLREWNRYLQEKESNIKTTEETKTITLPKLHISEKWGQPGNEDREILEMFLSKIRGDSIREKAKNIENFVHDCDEKCITMKDVSEILGNLVFLDCLAALIEDFNASSGGFLFESLISALIKGSQVPGNTQIEDIMDADGKRPFSLKFIKHKANVEWSPELLLSGIKKYGWITYIVVTKDFENNKIYFYSFHVGGSDSDIDYTSVIPGQEAHPKYITYTEYSQEQFLDAVMTLPTRENVKEIANKYVEKLGSTLTDIYSELDQLGKNINIYFANSPDSKTAGLRARENARILQVKTEELDE